ncbi:MAG TPA: GNA1162 family protein [Candidatus Angelobacter sp.]|nr:GNA1162 family protein [Candidatus Angelobacter sp.]
MSARIINLGILIVVLALAGCASKKPYDYAVFREHPPRSIVVLPPLNDSTDIKGTYSYLSTVTRPLAEMGYYVFPVAEVDELMKENGLPTAYEMQQAPLDKIGQIIGADSVLYVTLRQYGTKYEVISSVTSVTADAKLVDVKTGLTLWEGSTTAQQGSGDSGGGIIGALVTAAASQIVNSATDPAHQVSSMANYQLFTPKDGGLLPGPYCPSDRKQ